MGPNDRDSDGGWPDGYDYADSSGGLHDSAHDAVEASLGHEEGWGTGAGCGQDADNVGSGDSSSDSDSDSDD